MVGNFSIGRIHFWCAAGVLYATMGAGLPRTLAAENSPAAPAAPVAPATQQEAAATKPVINWGLRDKAGLQIGLHQPVAADQTILHCTIRNAGEGPIVLNLCMLGHEFRIWARPAGEDTWRRMLPQLMAYAGIGPTRHQNYTLAAGRDLPHLDSLPRRITRGNSDAAPATKPPIADYTFLLWINCDNVPAAWDGPIEFKITQGFVSDPARPAWSGQVDSGVVTVAAAALRQKMKIITVPPPTR